MDKRLEWVDTTIQPESAVQFLTELGYTEAENTRALFLITLINSDF